MVVVSLSNTIMITNTSFVTMSVLTINSYDTQYNYSEIYFHNIMTLMIIITIVIHFIF
jgi:hypothetical protein